ncbi:MAG: class I lanthipeptide [Prevotellaceae bacterium]|nr:class I lanthipeptide [Prevotellaceae bacterium]
MKKKVKKLVLKKTTIANLGDFIMNQLKGGEDSAFCLDGTYLDASYAGLCTAVQDTYITCFGGATCTNACTSICHSLYDGGQATDCAPCLTDYGTSAC